MKIEISPKFSIGETVYLNLPDGEARLVTDVVFYYSTKTIEYQVMDSNGQFGTMTQNELSKEKIIL